MYVLVNLQTSLIGNICKALNFIEVCTKINLFTGIFQGRFLYCKYFLKLLYFSKKFGCFGACNITTIRIHDRHLRIKHGNVIFSYYIVAVSFFRSLRYAGYKQFIWWVYQRMGKGRRRVIPTCVLWTICGTFREEDATYIPYNEGHLE